jgi:hypothetical protein
VVITLLYSTTFLISNDYSTFDFSKEPLLLFTSTSKWYPKCEIQSEAFFIAIEHG